jgi:hypothetical protein
MTPRQPTGDRHVNQRETDRTKTSANTLSAFFIFCFIGSNHIGAMEQLNATKHRLTTTTKQPNSIQPKDKNTNSHPEKQTTPHRNRAIFRDKGTEKNVHVTEQAHAQASKTSWQAKRLNQISKNQCQWYPREANVIAQQH